MTVPIGIDLGTTFSVVAHVSDDGTIEIVKNENGDTLTPSVVYFESEGSATVGADAKALAALAPDRVVAAIKRQMGTDFSLTFDGVAYRPEGISAIILRALVEAAARELGVDRSDLVAVVTVPAYFGTAEREATASAARIAGVETLDLVAEPVAAALSYGVSSEDRGAVLVYDLGGGTFDATIVKLTETGPQVVAVDGASQLGGLNFDERLGALLLERYAAAADDPDALDDEEFVLRTYADAEDVKKKLSRAESTAVPLSRNGKTARINVTRAEFDEATRALVDETLQIVDRVIASAVALGAARPSQVLLTGGSTRILSISTQLGSRLGVPVRLNDPDTAVANGAAIHARALATKTTSGEQRKLLGSSAVGAKILSSAPVRSVVPRALGIKIHDSNHPTGQRIFVQHIIAANTPLPVIGATATLATVVEGQARVRVELMEQAGSVAGEEVEFNRRILDGELSGLPEGLRAGSPIDFTLSVGTDGRIECIARERSSGKDLVLESYMDGVADSQEADAQRTIVDGLKLRS
jgi:molecular chaperone DnaK (HSP70)